MLQLTRAFKQDSGILCDTRPNDAYGTTRWNTARPGDFHIETAQLLGDASDRLRYGVDVAIRHLAEELQRQVHSVARYPAYAEEGRAERRLHGRDRRPDPIAQFNGHKQPHAC